MSPPTLRMEITVGATKNKQPALYPLQQLVRKYGLQPWEQAALLRAEGWTSDKQITDEAFAAAKLRLQTRTVAGGK